MRLRRSGRQAGAIGALALTLLALAPPDRARAAEAPAIAAVALAGEPAIGSPLDVAVSFSGDPEPLITYEWRRCDPLAPSACAAIAVADSAVYVPAAADLGAVLVVAVSATNAAGSASATSAPSAPVRAAAAPPYIDPFPVVRIRGTVAVGGASVTLLRVYGPRRARVSIRCDGRGCPLRERTRRPGRLRALERFLPAGVRITIRVARRGYVGKYARLRIRDGRAPTRRDACVISLRNRPVKCP
jgi:hypothetical protein